MTRKEAQSFIDSLVSLRAIADDKQASCAVGLYPLMKNDGSLIVTGTRINWNGKIKKAAADVWDREENSPDNAPTLWEDISYRDGIRIIPETITAGLAFSKDEQGYWGDDIYVSLIDNNVWTPEAYPQGWRQLSEGNEDMI